MDKSINTVMRSLAARMEYIILALPLQYEARKGCWQNNCDKVLMNTQAARAGLNLSVLSR